MAETVLYVYAITRDAVIPGEEAPDLEAVNQTRRFGNVESGGIAAVFTAVDAAEFSQEGIDRRAADLEWLGAIGYRHQAVVADLMKRTTIIPLRAFALFSSADAVRAYLDEHRAALDAVLTRLAGKQEWTLRIELEPQRWSEALTSRVASLAALQNELQTASTGKAFLLRKKLEDEKKKASREAELQLVAEIESAVAERLACETVAESRERREGAFPQINVLLNRDEESRLQELQNELMSRYAAEGVTLAVSGPWPPYTFASPS
ncbi:MAG TPA: GvpL/GvpF family gas vesicle protein [Thermoanaerobaculia bacterium]|nr:GvpL/GvpF family gas vesicle protein [Thermoanaerobaculia bacterium]